MDTTVLLERIAFLCKNKGVNATTAFRDSGVGKNFKSNLKTAGASDKNLRLLANYFNVPLEYLIGEADESLITANAMGEVIEWLTDNGYDISEDDNSSYTISRNGDFCCVTAADFANECMAIREEAKDGFELAMLDWEHRNFHSKDEYVNLTEQEKTLLALFRNTTEEGRFEMITSFTNIRNAIEKNNNEEIKKSIG